MSRIGRQPINIPAGVEVTIADNLVSVKGPKGELSAKILKGLEVTKSDTQVTVTQKTVNADTQKQFGLQRTLINNMIVGVSEGFKKELELVGVGYKAANTGNTLDLALGYSHNIIFEVPSEMKVSTLTEKGQNPKIFLEGIDKQLVGQVAAKLRSLRKPEPYKGKGVKYSDEIIRRKAGKAAGK
mgnify:CR=1 FL=1